MHPSRRRNKAELAKIPPARARQGFLRSPRLPERAEVQHDAAGAVGVLMEAAALAVEHQDFVVVVDLLGGPVGGNLTL